MERKWSNNLQASVTRHKYYCLFPTVFFLALLSITRLGGAATPSPRPTPFGPTFKKSIPSATTR